jgi:hypothetical protein
MSLNSNGLFEASKLFRCIFLKHGVPLEEKPHFSTCLKQLIVSFATIFL